MFLEFNVELFRASRKDSRCQVGKVTVATLSKEGARDRLSVGIAIVPPVQNSELGLRARLPNELTFLESTCLAGELKLQCQRGNAFRPRVVLDIGTLYAKGSDLPPVCRNYAAKYLFQTSSMFELVWESDLCRAKSYCGMIGQIYWMRPPC